MATAGPNNPSSSTGSTMTDPTNAYSSNDAWALTPISQVLKLMGYGFSVPAGSTIDGITVAVERKASANSKFEFVTDFSLKLIIDGSVAGDDKKDTITKWPTTEAAKSYGGVADLWGLTPTVDQVNASNFGVQFQPNCASGIAYVDVITITITYTEGGGGASAVPVIMRQYRQRMT